MLTYHSSLSGEWWLVQGEWGLRQAQVKESLTLLFDCRTLRHMLHPPTDQLEEFAHIFKALSNPNRLHIFMRLACCCAPGTMCEGDTAMRRCVGDLGQELSISPSTVSHHLKELRQAGLIKTQRRGQNIECWVDPDVLSELAKFFANPATD